LIISLNVLIHTFISEMDYSKLVEFDHFLSIIRDSRISTILYVSLKSVIFNPVYGHLLYKFCIWLSLTTSFILLFEI
uniref:NADH dehydrogenase subunit 5 n=1 Tax=Toxocara canis TaxID=6265 RepID=A0A183U9L9_TOXCA